MPASRPTGVRAISAAIIALVVAGLTPLQTMAYMPLSAPVADQPPPPLAVAPKQPTEADLKAQADVNAQTVQCGAPYSKFDEAAQGPRSSPVLQLASDTFWRPRGSDVRFTLSAGSTGTAPLVKRVWVCFRWSEGSAQHHVAIDHTPMPSPLVARVDNGTGQILYAAEVPPMTEAGLGLNEVSYTGLGTVPLADMLVVAQIDGGDNLIVKLPVGITYVPAALAILAAALGVTAIVLIRWAPPNLVRPGGGLAWLSNRVLALLSTSNGVASLSQFQIMLWTLVVGGSAVYVMVLSGNLIPITSGTLTLLGIAGGASILGRVQTPDEKATAMVQTLPRWRQLLLDGTKNDADEIDVTRVQMLIFTLISAAFVAIKVAVTYEIPVIPENFLLLMGISNGVYIAGKQIPSSPKGGSNTTTP